MPKSKNTLLRYKMIMDIYINHKTDDIPTTKVLKKYIFPKFPISRTTLYTILNTPIAKELKEIENQDNNTTV